MANETCAFIDGIVGVWMLYSWSDNLSVSLITTKPETAILRAESYEQIGFWPIGMTINEAVNWWEAKKREVADGESGATSTST